eukprot:TRINITY_DN7698_c0_g1_i1.p1 TRINITY_DN7698_c0_g1~~TRINITY_DN7698_c0_g1_i1.p1  ORF type:complete len:164 (+),score=59.60 TRINITY_DN7698_c0_g1_i1:152-643(+)
MSGKAVAGKIVKGIDWEFVAKAIVSEEGKKELFALKRTFDDISSSLASKMNPKPVTIDWAYYKKELNPKIVEIFESAYKSIEVPAYVDNDSPIFEKKRAELLAKAKAEEDFSKAELARLKKELQDIQEQKMLLKEQTVDDYLSKHPDVKSKIDAEIRSQKWDI